MPKPTALIYTPGKEDCRRLAPAFARDLSFRTVRTKSAYFRQACEEEIDVAILCFCYADPGRIHELIALREGASHLPMVVSTLIPDPEFIRRAAQNDFDHFVFCHMPHDRIWKVIRRAMEENGMRSFLDSHLSGKDVNPRVERIKREILHRLPRRPELAPLADSLDLSVRSVQSLIKEYFGCSFRRLTRRILVFRALNLMVRSHTDLSGIAKELGYADEGSLSRIFRKELGYPPSSAMTYLSRHTPRHLLDRTAP